ncbi:hypothetical protein GNF10_18695 [Nostoc sp. UCD121]|uniref:hypothetical protein n=1 Tax=unclassified Nostoc TaxID=2593658 RepID=UPI00162AAEBB|nr:MULTISPECIES: hypothetical protein [unclassified Nostoc]MBC1218770.1 hypothetical protein [Nostoc sp. UCD120]MBC1277928.1 hypothetical protein [Nostoc sp. UCD121]MBC1296355.1 hypothetical protein [Nostoc sp. UCD122]
METLKVVTIPNDWTSPKYSFGRRTKQGVIVGIQYYPPNSLLTGLCNESWRYALLDKNDFSEVSHLEEEKIHLVTPSELRAELQAEIEAHQRKILILKYQIGAISNA